MIFHSYVSLPEGQLCGLQFEDSKPKQRTKPASPLEESTLPGDAEFGSLAPPSSYPAPSQHEFVLKLGYTEYGRPEKN